MVSNLLSACDSVASRVLFLKEVKQYSLKYYYCNEGKVRSLRLMFFLLAYMYIHVDVSDT